jgi:hypothetical protein
MFDGDPSRDPPHSSAARLDRRLSKALNAPARVGIFGESGAGKTTVLKALLAEPELGDTPPSAQDALLLLQYGHRSDVQHESVLSQTLRSTSEGSSNRPKSVIYASRTLRDLGSDSRLRSQNVIHLENSLLKTVNLVEVPSRLHPASRADVWHIRRLHLALWITPATQAWKRSEYEKWRQWATVRPITWFLVVSRLDLLHEFEQRRVFDRLTREANAFSKVLPSPGAAKGMSSDHSDVLRRALTDEVRVIKNAAWEKARRISRRYGLGDMPKPDFDGQEEGDE